VSVSTNPASGPHHICGMAQISCPNRTSVYALKRKYCNASPGIGLLPLYWPIKLLASILIVPMFLARFTTWVVMDTFFTFDLRRSPVSAYPGTRLGLLDLHPSTPTFQGCPLIISPSWWCSVFLLPPVPAVCCRRSRLPLFWVSFCPSSAAAPRTGLHDKIRPHSNPSPLLHSALPDPPPPVSFRRLNGRFP